MLKNLGKAVKSKVADAKTAAKTSSDDADFKAIMKGYAFEGDGLRGSTHSAGHAMGWACYNAVREVSKEKVTVHVLNKAAFGGDRIDRDAKAALCEAMKAGLTQQVKIIHPGVLRVIEPVREKGSYMMYVTEPVLGSLANFLGDHSNVEVVRGRLSDYLHELSPQEKKFGLFQVAEAVAFLHGQVRVLHLNLTPAAIYIAASGDWKIGGFDFAVPAAPGAAPNGNFQQLTSTDMFDTSINPLLGPDLNYAAPEYVKQLVVNPYSDLFSYGCVVCEVLASRPGRRAQLINAGPNLAVYNSRVLEVQTQQNALNLQGCSLQEAETARILLAPRQGDMGASVAAVLASTPLFSDKALKCLIFIARLADKSEQQKVSFYKDLYGVIGSYDARIAKAKVLPCLTAELAAMPPQYILPLLLRLVPVLDAPDVEALLLPHLAPFMKADAPPQLAAILLERLTDLMAKLAPPHIARYVVPFVSAQLDRNASGALMDLLMQVSSKGVFEKDTVNALAPKVVRLAVKHPDAALRLQAVAFLIDMNHLVLRCTTQEVVLPAMRGSLLSETDAGVAAKVLEYYRKASEGWDMELVGGVVTHMVTALGNEALKDAQFDGIFGVTAQLLQEMKEKRARKRAAPVVRAAPPPPVAQAAAPAAAAEPSWEAALPFANAGPAPPAMAAPTGMGGFGMGAAPQQPPAAAPKADAFSDLGGGFGGMGLAAAPPAAAAPSNSPGNNAAASDWKPDWTGGGGDAFGDFAKSSAAPAPAGAGDGGFGDFGAFGNSAPAPAPAAAPAGADACFGLADWSGGAAASPAVPAAAAAPAGGGVFSDFGAASTPAPAAPAPAAGGGFADFGNFGQAPAPQGAPPTTTTAWNTFGANPVPPPPSSGAVKKGPSVDDLFGF
eukprot:TRINITY_DN2861_c0_g1_i1.p1 TRINITY_DN2861_c0_g1~~TRINITY_DN2861_c0_g1_i1.p1  ORF type:complete len:892 (+),score=340.35 TRINITY_DN2861_c0_g1_i1:112-2787(+)